MRLEPHAFALWAPEHLWVIGLTVLATTGLILTRQRMRGWQDLFWRRSAAAALLVNEVGSWIWAAAHGIGRIPLQLCDLAVILTVIALWTLGPRVSELAYFWGVTGSLQAILTPDLRWGFPDYWWIKFFLTHCGVVLGVVYLAVTGRVRPTVGSVWRVWMLTNVYAALAGLINWGCRTNYGYLAHKPMQPSLLDYLGPWPLYIAVVDVAALGMFALAYVPFRLKRT